MRAVTGMRGGQIGRGVRIELGHIGMVWQTASLEKGGDDGLWECPDLPMRLRISRGRVTRPGTNPTNRASGPASSTRRAAPWRRLRYAGWVSGGRQNGARRLPPRVCFEPRTRLRRPPCRASQGPQSSPAQVGDATFESVGPRSGPTGADGSPGSFGGTGFPRRDPSTRSRWGHRPTTMGRSPRCRITT